MKNSIHHYCIKRSDYLLALQKVYDNDSTDYLIALRDGLSLLILTRNNPNAKPLKDYEGYVKYL